MNWKPIQTMPVGKAYMTKVDDEKGVRNITKLMKKEGTSLFFTADEAMYVYYAPTHWKED